MRTINLEDFSDELGKFSAASIKQKQAAVMRGLYKSIPDLVAASPVDTGLYASAWEVEKTGHGGKIRNTAPYAGVIEYGARPFTPPIGPLLAWAKRHLGQGGAHDTGQPETNYTPEVWAFAKAVQHKIAEHGMKPHHVLENMIPQIVENIKREFKRIGA